jgi:DNA primase
MGSQTTEGAYGFTKLDGLKPEAKRRIYEHILRSLEIGFVIEDLTSLKSCTPEINGQFSVMECPMCRAKNETGTLYINEQRQVFMCKGCKSCGDVIEFVRKFKHALTTQGAIQYLCDRYRLSTDIWESL